MDGRQRFGAAIALVGWIAAPLPAAAGLKVALEVRETAGVARVKDPCRSGVPLPPGAVRDVAKLRL